MAAVQYLLDSGAEVNVEDRWGNTALDEAATARHDDVIKSVDLSTPPALTDTCGIAMML